jgi:glycosyltransferase involved in cell wall biosynthesis
VREVHWRGDGRWRRPIDLGNELQPGDLLILNSGYLLCNLIAARVAHNRRIKYLVVPHGAYPIGVRRRRRAVRTLWEIQERTMLERALAVHLFFEKEIDDLRQIAPKARYLIAPSGFHRLSGTWTGSGDYIGWYGRYAIEGKGLDLLLSAMSALPELERPRLALRGMPSKNKSDDVKLLVEQMGLQPWVDVGGPVLDDEKIAFLVNAKGFVHPSRWEAQSMAIMEALSIGVPLLVTNGTNIAEPLRERAAAIVVDPNPMSIAQGLQTLVTEDNRNMAERGRSALAELFDWSKTAASFLDQIQSVF